MKIILLAHDIRSTHNIGAFFRTCDCLGIDELIFSGYTPHPTFIGDERLPHFADKLTRQIHKTALGAEQLVPFRHFQDLEAALAEIRQNKGLIVALENVGDYLSTGAVKQQLATKHPNRDIVLLVGNELHGIAPAILAQADLVMGIDMVGGKESLNVSVAAGIALFELSQLRRSLLTVAG